MENKLLDTDLEIIPKIESKLNIFICGKYGNSYLYSLFINNKGYDDKKNIINYNKNKKYYQKNKLGIEYNRTKNEFGNSYWKFYELAPIKSSKECESLKNLIEKKAKKNKTQNVIIYICGENDYNDLEILNQLKLKILIIHLLFLKHKKEQKNIITNIL